MLNNGGISLFICYLISPFFFFLQINRVIVFQIFIPDLLWQNDVFLLIYAYFFSILLTPIRRE